MASPITDISTVCWTASSSWHERKHQSSALLSLCEGKHWSPRNTSNTESLAIVTPFHGDVIKWKILPRYSTFVRGIYRSAVNSPHKGLWRRALIASLICAWTNSLANNWDAGAFRRHRAHCDITVMFSLLEDHKQWFRAVLMSQIIGSACSQRNTKDMHYWPFCEGNPPDTGRFSLQRASIPESVSIYWRHHVGNQQPEYI